MTSSIPANRSRIPPILARAARSAIRKLAVSGNVEFGHSLRLGLGASVSSSHGLVLGHTVSIGQRSVVEVDGSIGNYCLIGRHVQILGRMDHQIDEVGVPMAISTWVGDRAQDAADSVQIGDDVWIGAGSIILGGVSIGSGSVIGAGSVVTRNVGECEIHAGNPAKFIRNRFTLDLARREHLASIQKLG